MCVCVCVWGVGGGVRSVVELQGRSGPLGSGPTGSHNLFMPPHAGKREKVHAVSERASSAMRDHWQLQAGKAKW